MSEKQNTTNQSNNTNSSANTISQSIFAKPIMSTETRAGNNTGVQMRTITEGVEMKKTTFTKDENN